MSAWPASPARPRGPSACWPNVGTLEAGKACDLAIWDIERPAELVYRMGFNPLHARIWKGLRVTEVVLHPGRGASPTGRRSIAARRPAGPERRP
jgi:cytosine/adenosine deaminase-related metal-dependent hydrolase